MRLQEIRKQKGITQQELANMAAVSQSMIALIESKRRSPSPSIAKRIADALELSTEEMWEMFYSNDNYRYG